MRHLPHPRFLVAPACLGLALALFGATVPDFLSPGNAANVLSQMWVLGLLAVGQMFAIVTRGFDISVGATAALASTAAALGANALGPAGLLLAPLVGIACGTVNGVLVGRLGLQPIVATLGSLVALRGVALLVSDDGQVVPLAETGLSDALAFDPVAGLPPAAWGALALCLAAAWTLARSTLGRRILMLGSNPEAVRLIGIDAGRTTLRAYQLCGLFAGLAGLLMTLRAGAGLPTEGTGMELQAIAAAVIGGTALSGGIASVAGVLLGAAFIQALLTGLNLQGLSPFVAQAAVGAVIIGAGLLEFAVRTFLSPIRNRKSWT